MRRFAALVGRCDLALDVGAGASPYARVFAAKRLVRLDITPRGAVIRADCQRLPFRSGVADLILCTEVLEHVRDMRAALDEMARVAKPGGYLVVSMPFLWGRHEATDVRRLTEPALVERLHLHGFELLELRRRGGIFCAIAGLLTQVPNQLFGPFEGPGGLPRMVAAAVLYAVITPLVWLLVALDPLDRRQDFTLGYSVLARRKPGPGAVQTTLSAGRA
jgi:SAM-dependent methyltransferase